MSKSDHALLSEIAGLFTSAQPNDEVALQHLFIIVTRGANDKRFSWLIGRAGSPGYDDPSLPVGQDLPDWKLARGLQFVHNTNVPVQFETPNRWTSEQVRPPLRFYPT
jgi:hypothetical protein